MAKQVATPPEPSKQLIVQVATLLAVGAAGIPTIRALQEALMPFGYASKAIEIAFKLSKDHNKVMSSPGAGLIVRVGWSTYQYRAAYILSSSKRLTLAMRQGEEQYKKALENEKRYYEAHVHAQQRRAQAIQQTVDEAQKVVNKKGAKAFEGNKSSVTPLPILVGWYAKMDVNTSTECRLANGKNFDATKGTLIGYPGSVHPHCRCKAGPPHKTKALVDDAIRATISRKEKALA